MALVPVQGKVSGVFVTHVVETPSGKRDGQSFSVVAGHELNPDFVTILEDPTYTVIATEKIDAVSFKLIASNLQFCGRALTEKCWIRHSRANM